MQVNTAGYSASVGQSKQATGTQSTANNAVSVNNSSDVTASSSQSGAVATNDFSNMTPKQMNEVADKLYKSGKIDLTQLFKLVSAGGPLGRMVDGKIAPLSDAERANFENTPVNYLDMFKGNIAFMEQSGQAANPKSGYADMKKILSVLNSEQGKVSGADISV